MGADAVLLMATSLSKEDYERLYRYTYEKGMHALVEIHELAELDVVSDIKPQIIGVNSRNLKTLEIDKEKGASIIKSLGYDVIVAESGLKTEEDIRMMSEAGATGFLVGSSLMGSDDPAYVSEVFRRGSSDVCEDMRYNNS